MAGREEPYDPYIPAGGGPAGHRGETVGTPRTEHIQAVGANQHSHPSS